MSLRHRNSRAVPAPLCFSGVPTLQLAIPWALRALVRRQLSMAEELLEVLAQDAEPLVAEWARVRQNRVRSRDDLIRELEQLEADGGPVARSLAETVRTAWREFGGRPLPTPLRPQNQPELPFPFGRVSSGARHPI